jgi:dihydrofolate reductase
MITMIAALGLNGVLGKDNDLLWHLPRDMQHFRKATLNKVVLMGRKTFLSFGAKPLPQRTNIILTRDKKFDARGVQVVHTLEEALKALRVAENEAMVIGGGELYKQILPYADRLLLTVVDVNLEGDTYFPNVDYAQWHLVKEEWFAPDERHAYGFWIRDYRRK